MADFYHKNKKLLTLSLSIIFFIMALSYTLIFGLSKTVTVELDTRMSQNSETVINTIDNASLIKTVGEVLEENELPVVSDYSYETDLDTKIKDVDLIKITKKVPGNLYCDNQIIPYESSAKTVGDLLNEQDITVSIHDTVTPSPETPLTMENSEVVINRIVSNEETREESIPFDVQSIYDPNLVEGTVEVDVPGIDGTKEVVENVTYQDGVSISREVLNEKVLLAPINQVERVGTRSKEGTTSSQPIYVNLPNSTVLYPAVIDNSNPTYYNGTTLSDRDFDLVCAIVEHEGGSNYTGALAVMSCVMNRVDDPDYPDDPVSVLTAPGQFASYLDGYYLQFLGNHSTSVKQAVIDCLNGKRSHNYLNFRSYQTTNSVNIGGNWFF